jgi:VWFA-related protein
MKIKTYLAAGLLLLFASYAFSQLRARRTPPQPTASPQSAQPTNPGSSSTEKQQSEPPQGDVETIKIDTNLVAVPVIASSRTGHYIADLTKEEFKVWEDGVPQEVAFFATVNVPFHVVLMLDTSASTKEKLAQIQQAAMAFVQQLGSDDKVKIVSFDDEVRDLNDFTNDKVALREIIKGTHSGEGTKVYDAVQLSLHQLRVINGRKAIVIFTDGVDWHSDSATFDGTIHDLDELGAIVYPIRFDTRADTERMLRQQDAQMNGIQLPTSDVIRGTRRGSTPTTFPGDEPSPVPDRRPSGSSLPFPSPDVIFRRQRNPTPTGSPTDPFPDTAPRTTDPRTRVPPPPTGSDTRTNDSIGAMLDNLYLTGDSYLKSLADHSGGQLYRADTLGSLPQAFAAIAAELRTQYTLGYYPTNRNHDGTYRKIQVKTSRKDVAVRARPGYRAPSGG